MRMMNFCKLLFAVLLFLYATFKLFLRHPFNTFFFAKEQDKKRPFEAEYVTRKLKWKFAIRAWFVILTISVRELCQKSPCMTLFEVYRFKRWFLSV